VTKQPKKGVVGGGSKNTAKSVTLDFRTFQIVEQGQGGRTSLTDELTVRPAKLKPAVFEDFGSLDEFYIMSKCTTRQIQQEIPWPPARATNC